MKCFQITSIGGQPNKTLMTSDNLKGSAMVWISATEKWIAGSPWNSETGFTEIKRG